MTKNQLMSATALVFLLVPGTILRAQAPGQTSTPAVATPVWERQGPVPIRVQIVISKYQGERRVSSLPYTLSVSANDGQSRGGKYAANTIVRLRMGAQVPIWGATPSADGKTPVTYKEIGTSIECYAWAADNERFNVSVVIADSSVYGDGQATQGAAKPSDMPTFRNFQSESTVILKDGQSSQFTAATDKVSGETTRVEVTINVVK